MAKKQFKAESKRLLELMIHSIYTHREIFLRELISNASDAMDKLYYHALTNHISGISREDLTIRIEIDKEARTLTIRDNGIGMTREELENNLGVIAKSGSLEFKKENQQMDDVDIIGQFGVGFYAAFMVSDQVKVVSKAFGSDQAYVWESSGVDGYTVEPCEKEGHGTDVILHILPSSEEYNYDEFLQPYRIRELVKKYSDYIRYPIQMEVEKRRLKEGSDKDKPEYETYTELETLNSMVPLWKKNRNELTDDDYNRFYMNKFMDFEPPLKVIHSSGEGAANYHALLFIPARAPLNYYTREYEKGLMLYASGVLVMEKCADLLPDHFGFVKGLVDSQDLSLNISREMLQHDRQLKLIATRLEKKIKSELLSMLNNQREQYERFFTQFGIPIKAGICADFGIHKELLQDLLLFHSSYNTPEPGKDQENSQNRFAGATTLAEYVGRMKEGQKYIYYACGDSVQQVSRLPQTERVLDKGYEILYLTDDVDEFVLRSMGDFDGKEFRSVSSGDLGFEDEDAAQDKQDENQHKELFDYMQQTLAGKVKAVRASKRLKTHPVCLTSEGEVTIEMEKFFRSMPDGAGRGVKAERVLEVNPSHPVVEVLEGLLKTDRDKLALYTNILYNSALLIEGLPIDDPTAFSNQLCELMK